MACQNNVKLQHIIRIHTSQEESSSRRICNISSVIPLETRRNCLLTTSSLQGRWIGIKAVFYNLPDGSVKLEQWVDDGTSDNSNNNNPSGNNWHRVLTFVDN